MTDISSQDYWNLYTSRIYRSDIRLQCLNYTSDIINILDRFEHPFPKALDIGPGWIPLIVDLHDQLKKISSEYRIHQIKQKHAKLRYYAYPIFSEDISLEDSRKLLNDFSNLCYKAEDKSATMCEQCFDIGNVTRISIYSMMTLCSTCRSKY